MSANFNIMLHGMTDTGVVETTRKAKSQRQCVFQCASVFKCRSLNYRKTKGQCELLGSTLKESVPFLRKQNDLVYMTTDDLALNVSKEMYNLRFNFYFCLYFLYVFRIVRMWDSFHFSIQIHINSSMDPNVKNYRLVRMEQLVKILAMN